ncbi:MAG: diguanylate cyclase [Thiotrichales bacterium]|nr:diguanylate cyclase [Thiotrichales bacterium]
MQLLLNHIHRLILLPIITSLLAGLMLFPALIMAQEKITIGLLAFRPKPVEEAKWQPLVNYLNQHVPGLEFKLIPLNYGELEDAIARKNVDFVFTNSAHYVQLAYSTKMSSPLVTLINKKSGQVVRSFGGTILVKNDNNAIQTLKDLQGKTIATPSIKSFGGFEMQAFELLQVGINIDEDITIIQTTMPHDKAVQSLITNQADAAFVRSGVLESLEKSGDIKPNQFRVLNAQNQANFPFLTSTRLYPEWPLVAMPHVGENLAGRVTAALLALPHDNATTNAIGIYGFSIPADYEPVREVLRALKVYPYNKLTKITFADIWQQNRQQIIAGLLALTIIGFLIVLLFIYNRRLHTSYANLQELNASHRLAAAAFDTQEAIFITDHNEKIIRTNNAFTQVTGFTDKEVLGKTPRILSSHTHSKKFYDDLWQDIKTNGYWQGEIINQRKNGEQYPVRQNITAVKDDEGNVSHYLSTFNDISVYKSNQEQIQNLAFYDPLTNLANRRLLQDHLKQARAQSARNKDYFAVLFIDLDHFKNLNDTLGHDYGDQLLIQVGQRLEACVREVDTVARPGGDEFIVLLEKIGATEEDAATQAKHIGDKILTQVSMPYLIKGHECIISASIGVSLSSDHFESVEELMVRSDLAMYQAKSAGRNSVRFFDPSMQASILERSLLENDLRKAIAQNEFVLFYQPKLDQQAHILGYEALIRWQHPIKGLLSPGVFIEVAESCGLIVEMVNGSCNRPANNWRFGVNLSKPNI